jgi:hypothetical protein
MWTVFMWIGEGPSMERLLIRVQSDFGLRKTQEVFWQIRMVLNYFKCSRKRKPFFAKYSNYYAVIFSANEFVIPNIIPSRTMQNIIRKVNEVFILVRRVEIRCSLAGE